MSDEEIKIDDDASHDSDDAESRIKKLKEKLKTCERERGEYLDGWQRSKADYANYKREVAERAAEEERRIKSRLVRDLVPVLDSIDHAREWIKDMRPIEAQLEKVMEGYGLEKVGAAGETFDPSKHESIESVVVDSEEKDNIIVELVTRGYVIEGRVIKPARVKVGHYKKL